MVSKKPIRIAIASDQPIFLRGLATLIMSVSGVQLVGEARSAAEAYQLAELVAPDILLLDCKRVLVLGRDVAMAILEKRPEIKIGLLLAPPEEAELKQQPIDEGLYYISREVTDEEFIGALTEMLGQSEQHPAGAQVHNLFGHAGGEDDPEETIEVPAVASLTRSTAVMTRELEMAGKIQADILPEEVPVFPGWEVAARLEPARETSGDYYDFIPLTASKWAIVVADVTDKGMGAALFMALSSSLIRTYATRFPTLPALTVSAVSGRILSDTHGSMFVTALFGVLEPDTGRFIFANAGHPPGYLITTQRGETDVERLRPTGMALGVSEQAQWRQKIARMSPGDLLLLYTDGITEAQNDAGEFFGEEHLLDCVLAKKDCSAEEVLQALLDEVHRFVGGTPRQDDIALVVVRRKP